jgi:hypothetical protein
MTKARDLADLVGVGITGTNVDYDNTVSGISANTMQEAIDYLLDDYEEGTWTPNIVGEVTTSNGTYTKVGSLVTANFYIYLPNIGFSQDPALIAGLPFTANITTAARKSGGFLAYNSDGKAASLLFETGGDRVGFRSDPGGTALDRGTVAGNTYYGTLIYNTDS